MILNKVSEWKRKKSDLGITIIEFSKKDIK